jgi:hypothetical protein
MRHLAAAEEDRGFYFVALFEEAQHVVLFELVVVLVDVDAELYFLDSDDLLVLLGRALLLLFFIQELAVVLDATDRGIRGGRNFHQIESSFTGDFERLKRLHDAELSSGFVDYADFAGANTLIDADKTLIDNFPPRGYAAWDRTDSRSIAWASSLSGCVEHGGEHGGHAGQGSREASRLGKLEDSLCDLGLRNMVGTNRLLKAVVRIIVINCLRSYQLVLDEQCRGDLAMVENVKT